MQAALIGNQNSGKTTLFNLLTGSNQQIGNWPGVTIEKKSGALRGAEGWQVVDLPGIYSLSPYTSEENVSRDFVLNSRPDLIINIIDATSIERSLYLTTQILELDCPVVLALNMADIMKRKGVTVNEQKLSAFLGVPVVSISALKRTGIDKLIDAVKKCEPKKSVGDMFSPQIERAVQSVQKDVVGDNKRFKAVKLLERDVRLAPVTSTRIEQSAAALEKSEGMDTEQIFADARYKYIARAKAAAITVEAPKESVTDKLDKVFLNKWAAIPIFAAIMALIYFLSVGLVGTFTVDLVDGGFGKLAELANNGLLGIGASDWAASLVSDGIIAGVGAALNFVPQLIIMFLCLALLETTGYMSRIAFFLDRLFKRFGLSGKSLIPFIVGVGCSVPAIMSTRTIEDEDEKRMTIMLTPFIPCSAKLPIISMFGGYFFGAFAWVASLSLYMLAIAVILVSALIMKKFFFKGQPASFISELPDYKLPSPRYVLRQVWERIFAFIKRAGTVILLCSVIIWFLASFSFKFEYGVDIGDSMLAGIGNCLAWVFYPMLGEWSWAATVSAIQGLVAKEQVVSSMAVIAGLAEDITEGGLLFGSGVFLFFTDASAYAFMVFNLFSAPCFGAIGAMRRELGSAKKMWVAIAFQTGIAWVLATVINAIGSLILLL
ncbi:MAG: ferrous iron transport protein B [Clostridia bacterium]|nr:ferrous iron transport protein B [Clostridia bacterium]